MNPLSRNRTAFEAPKSIVTKNVKITAIQKNVEFNDVVSVILIASRREYVEAGLFHCIWESSEDLAFYKYMGRRQIQEFAKIDPEKYYQLEDPSNPSSPHTVRKKKALTDLTEMQITQENLLATQKELLTKKVVLKPVSNTTNLSMTQTSEKISTIRGTAFSPYSGSPQKPPIITASPISIDQSQSPTIA